MAETPSVRGEILPAYVARVMPQGAHLKEKKQKRLKHSPPLKSRISFHEKLLKRFQVELDLQRASVEFPLRHLSLTVYKAERERRVFFFLKWLKLPEYLKGQPLVSAHSPLAYHYGFVPWLVMLRTCQRRFPSGNLAKALSPVLPKGPSTLPF